MQNSKCWLPAPAFLLALPALALTGCLAPAPRDTVAQRLVDDFKPAMLSGGQGTGALPAPLEWRLDDPAAGWRVVVGIQDASLTHGRLSGVAASPAPALLLPAVTGLAPGDLVHEVQVRMKVSANGQFGIHFMGAKPNSFDQLLLAGMPIPWPQQAPVTASDEVETFLFKPSLPVSGAEVAQLLIKPVDVPGAHFEVESVRIVSQREHLAAIPSGIGWQGMDHVFRETLVTHAPENIRWEVTVPDQPRLSFHFGTMDEQPVTFRVELMRGQQTSRLLERTLTTPLRWEEAALDLDAWRGQRVALNLSLSAAEPGALGLWGAPALRSRTQPMRRADTPRPRGVILVLADTLRADRLEAYGNTRPVAPSLARLAQEGVLFRDAISQASWTKVSAPSLLTSLYPTTSGVRDFPDRLPSAATTLAEVYRQAGYATVGYSSLLFTGYFSNLHQGFEEHHERTFDPGDSKTARVYVDHLLPWLEAHRDEPFFVFLHVFDPHDPYEPPRPWNQQWADPAWRAEHMAQTEKVKSYIPDPRRSMFAMATPGELRAAGIDPQTYTQRQLDWYDGSISAMDTELNRLFERLRELGLDRETLVAVVSDHGEEFHDHGAMFHGQSVYRELTQVPMILHYPAGIPAGTKVEETVGLIDLMPTLLDLSGLPIPAAAQGRSLLPLLRAQHGQWQPRAAFSERPFAIHPASPPPYDTESYAAVDRGFKLVWNIRRTASAPEYELYDRRTDPKEQRNVATQYPTEVRRLAASLATWRATAVAQRLPSDSMMSPTLSPEERERLRSLGYLR